LNKLATKSRFEKVPLALLFDWHIRDGAFERLSPPWLHLCIISRKGSIDNGGIVTVKLPLVGNMGVKLRVKHAEYIKYKSFKEMQIGGLFSHWEHQHHFADFGNGSELEDKVEYDIRWGPITGVVSSVVDDNLRRMFGYRHRITKMDMDTHQRIKNPGIKNILVSGSNGFVGSALVPFLTTGGYEVSRLLRNSSSSSSSSKPLLPDGYDMAKRVSLHPSETLRNRLNGNFDAVINLNGENIFGLWSKSKKKKIFDSRIKHTKSLCINLSGLDKPPKVLISASAIGIYGNDHNDKVFDESDEFGEDGDNRRDRDFLSYVCSQWEEATEIAKDAGIRVVNLRMGTVLGSSGGVLKKVVALNRLKANLGFGRHNWFSWISMDDLLRIILFCICNDNIAGPVNAVTPNSVQFQQFMGTLGKIWNTKINIQVSPNIVRRLLGELSKYTILSDIKAVPGTLVSNGFNFIFEDLESALRHTLGKTQ
jgi:uncharacterized protein (TIGR01777 family)